jgi:hypothetical protein
MLASMKHETLPTSSAPLLSGTEFLQFAIEFAQMNLDDLREGDWLNLREDFETYTSRRGWVSIESVSGACVLVSCVEPPLPENFELRHFQALQRVTLPLLRQIASQTGSFSTFADVLIALFPHGWNGSTPGRHQVVIKGTTEQCFLNLIFWLVMQEPPDRILACPECQTLFYRVKQQAYCSRKCGNRVTVRNFRARIQGGSVTKEAPAHPEC